jgi:hypothetical protein
MAATVQAPAAVRPAGGRAGSDARFYRAGAIAGFIATALGIVANAMHPRDLFDLTGGERLQRIADFGPWLVVHFAVVVAVVLGLITFMAVYRSIADGPSPWARPAIAFVLVSIAVALVSFVMDGFGLWGLAQAWTGATGSAKTTIASTADAMTSFETALFVGNILTFFGAAPIVGGMALWTDGTYPRWVAGLGVVGGIVGFAAGTVNFLAGEITDFAFIVLFTISSVLVTVWFLALSVLLWRRSQATV